MSFDSSGIRPLNRNTHLGVPRPNHETSWAGEQKLTDENQDEQRAIEKYRLLFDLWMSENSVKTNKLQMLMATNAILVSALSLTKEPVVWIASAGFVFSMVWVFSIGRTVGYQSGWFVQMEQIRQLHNTNAIFQIHNTKPKVPIWGRVPSKYYLLGTPLATTLAWLMVIIYALFPH